MLKTTNDSNYSTSMGSRPRPVQREDSFTFSVSKNFTSVTVFGITLVTINPQTYYIRYISGFQKREKGSYDKKKKICWGGGGGEFFFACLCFYGNIGTTTAEYLSFTVQNSF